MLPSLMEAPRRGEPCDATGVRLLDGQDLRHDAEGGILDHREDSERQGKMEATGATGTWVQEQAIATPGELRPVRVAVDNEAQALGPVRRDVLPAVDHAEGQPMDLTGERLREHRQGAVVP